MKLHCSAILLAFTLFSPSFCDPISSMVSVNNKVSEIVEATTLHPPEHDHPVIKSPPTTVTVTPTGFTIPDHPTTLPPEAVTGTSGGTSSDASVTLPSDIVTTPEGVTVPEVPTTIAIDTTSKPPEPSTTTVKPSNSTTTQSPPPKPTTSVSPPPTKPTEKPPKSTETPTPLPTASPHKGRQFDGPSFIGGIVLACGLTAIGFVAFKFYKARTERNYHTLSNKFVYEMPERNDYS